MRLAFRRVAIGLAASLALLSVCSATSTAAGGRYVGDLTQLRVVNLAHQASGNG